MAPVPRGRARTLAPAEQTDFQPSWPPGLTAQRPLSTLRKPHPEKNNTYFFQHLPESTMTPRQEVWKLVAKGPKGVCILGLRVAADLSLLLSRAWCRAALWEVLPNAGAPSRWLCAPCEIHPLHITPTPRTSHSQPPASRSPSCFWSCNFLHFVKSKFWLYLTRPFQLCFF